MKQETIMLLQLNLTFSIMWVGIFQAPSKLDKFIGLPDSVARFITFFIHSPMVVHFALLHIEKFYMDGMYK